MDNNPDVPMNKANRYLIAAIGILTLALFVTAFAYYKLYQQNIFLKYSLNKQSATYQDKISALETEKTGLQDELKTASSTLKTLAESEEKEDGADTFNSGIKLPVVVYGRPGLLNNDAAGRAEKKNLEAKFVQPFVDYHTAAKPALVSLYITVPVSLGEPYGVDAIYEGGGSSGFLFGERGGNYDYWMPTCMGECPFTPEFAKKYPQIVKASNSL